MVVTSLAEQLQKLSVPQATIYKEEPKKASLLFDPKEAALKDRDVFYEIGISGLKELISLYEGFRLYEDTLFSQSSKDFERAVQTKEVNKNLDHTIEKFLLELSPYLLLQSAHKSLEWLVNRYHIHQYNQDAIMALILPYHETKIFIRFVQLLDVKSASNRWNWLEPIQKPGIPLSKQVLFNQCASNTATLHFVAKITLNYVETFGNRATQLTTVYSFFCSVAIGTMDTCKRVKEPIINALLPTLMNALVSPILHYRSSAYIILGYLSIKAKIKKNTINDILDKILTSEFDLSYDMVLLMNIFYKTQEHLTKMSGFLLCNISVDTMKTICYHLKQIVEANINIEAFTLAFLATVLPRIQKDSEEFKRFCQLPEILLNEINLQQQHPEKIIKYIINSFQQQKSNGIEDGDESDIEIIDESDFTVKLLQWYVSVLRNMECKYPDAFDKVIKEEFNSNISTKRRNHISKLLGFKPGFSHKVSGTYLFQSLNHENVDIRVEAVKYISKEFDMLKNENIEFVKSSIVNRFHDDNPNVVNAALLIPSKCLKDVLSESDLTDSLIRILSKSSKKWKTVIKDAIEKFCSLEILPVNQETVLALVPYLFSYDENSAELAWNIINSSWGERFQVTNKIGHLNDSLKYNNIVLNQMIFKALFVDRVVNFNDILDINHVNKDNTLQMCMFLLLKSCSIDKATIQEITKILDLLLESLDHRQITSSADSQKFSSEIMSEFVKLSRKDKIVFEVIEYIFFRIVEDMKINDITKPWCNICKTSETILVRKLYEIFIAGCAIPNYESCYSILLQHLLKKFFSDPKEKFEFIANFACGHILYANNPKYVIGPELQLRSLKLMNNFIATQGDLEWLYDSNVFLLTILFNLNNPIVTIRQFAIDMVNNLLRNEPDKKYLYIKLLKEILEHKEELLLDHEQISQVMATILTQQTSGSKIFRKNCLQKLMNVLTEGTPAHITSEFLRILSDINNPNAFVQIIPVLNPLEKFLKENELNEKLTLDIYESKLLRNVYGRINESTVTTFNKKQTWNSIAIGLKEYRECVLKDDQTYTSPSVLIMKQINEEVFKKVPEEKCKDLVYLIASAGTFSNNPAISSVASKVMKKIHVQFSDFKPILEKMLNVEDPATNMPKKKKSSVSMISYQLTETDEWRLGVTLFEYVQNKKRMTVDNSFVSILFQLLNKCLRFEEQSHVEYMKQLILSSLWYYCKKFVDDTDTQQIQSLKSMFDIELVVQCIRGTQNPQTQHHALILLSHAAYMLPEQVLHHTMEIFTFMGSSVLRHDDAYSFQIIIKIIETLMPILVKLEKDIEDHTEKELQQLQRRVVPVLRIFADVVLHVPEHRRLPLYKKLLETLGPSKFLWVFLGLLLEAHIAHFNENKEKNNKKQRTLADKEAPMNRLDFGQNIVLEFPPEIGLENFIKLIIYIKSLPLQKDENSMDTNVDPSEIFSVNGHTTVQLRHYKYVMITFINTCLASSRFIQHSNQATDIKTMETHYKTFIINILTFIQSISKISDEKTAKYWRVMLHHSYDLLDHTNNLLSAPMFLSVVRGLLKHNLQTVRRKAMELLNSKIQFSPEMFENINKELVFSLLPPLLDIVKTIDSNVETENEIAAQEIELNQQTALLSLKLLTRLLATEDPEPFKTVLEMVTEYICTSNISGNVMASIVLCLAELCSNLKAHALASLRKFMPALIKVLKKQRKAETPELVLLSTVTAISKIIESLPLFLSPYLQKILYEYSILFAKWQASDQESSKVSAIITKLSNIKKKIASSIPPRVLVPVANETHRILLEKENFDAIGPVMSVLADTFENITTADFAALQQDLTTFFLSALQLRSDAVEKDVDGAVIDKAEDEVVKALVCLVLKLSENNFRPFYFKIYDWAIRTNVEGYKDRAITFYRLSSAIAHKLKGLFVLFAGHFIKNASELLDSCNITKSEQLYFDSEEKCITLVNYILRTLHIVFLYDSQNFINKDKFEVLMQPVVDQLENTLGGISSLKSRAAELLIPCIAQFAIATADDSLWKLLNYQILLKTRHNDGEIRLIALECLVAMATQLGSSWLPLLAESVPFLAELLEDGDSRIESSTKDAIRKLEQILGEPLEKYF